MLDSFWIKIRSQSGCKLFHINCSLLVIWILSLVIFQKCIYSHEFVSYKGITCSYKIVTPFNLLLEHGHKPFL